MRDARTETFEHTINGLLTKRRDLLTEAERLRDRIAEIRNDLLALDRTLSTLGYDTGQLEAMMPRQKRQVIFGRGELLRAIMDVLRDAERPMRSREIAQELVAVRGDDPRDQRFIADLTKRVGKALRESGAARTQKDTNGCIAWQMDSLRWQPTER